ncbi:1-deoxy-D-xylulose 5-phosphate reductoisomerase [Desulfofundulus australicus DSM 11792]|uniref:1-deoxy-D-xylulose 5-phosphate reductoisomerase n=1 Tax=Desulfofundulus australicus DSM 11792 TaxID=1121425 RepID=A0A1M4UQH7_9FIRM|nr:1-deoxy-D-xylulose-5-phosphate reductoisomerase [Desulfofundulus australicus]SHE58986.1 1-deoxy-D-xylulose 5-phosphate reductoisomerase [Desulfofundulus australicus DSM 11792]
MKNIVILGSTGSIGRQALDVARRYPDKIRVIGLAAGSNWSLMVEQIGEFKPRVVALAREEAARELARHLPPGERPEIFCGSGGLLALVNSIDDGMVLNALTGTAGLRPTMAALEKGLDVALANKETLVAAGELVMKLARNRGARILPVDSEHSAIWQCLAGQSLKKVEKIILTASGGPFRIGPPDLSRVTVSEALAHPNWKMGKKITIDSATLMNKGLEVMEAHWLFDMDYDRIEVVIHPQSIIHSMVEFVDGSVIAQMGLPDMRLPIQYALSYPDRWPGELPRVNWFAVGELTFEPPDTGRFPCLTLAYSAGRAGGTMPAVLNAANEVAVEAFLSGEIPFTGIYRVVAGVMDEHTVISRPTLEEILAADQWARRVAREKIRR